MNDCLFCKIVSGEVPCHKVYEDENFLAFLDINPVNQGHTLVIPKKHSKNILEMDDSLSKEIILVVKKLAKKIKTSLKSDGINILINNEAGAGQIIFHTHIHIIPRFLDDNLKHWPSHEYKKEEAQVIAKKIKPSVN